MDHERIDLRGCPVDAVDLTTAVARVARWVDAGDRRALGLAVNASKVAQLARDPELRALARRADLVIADGWSIVAASRLEATPLPARVTGVDLATALLEEAARRGWRAMLLGGRPEIVAEAARRTGASAHHHGYASDEELAAAVRAVAPDLLLVGLGSPRQERFLARWAPEARFAMGVGGAIDVLAGATPRAPQWLGDRGLEWAWRLAREPRARWRRALLDSARFVAFVARGDRLPSD